MIFTLFNEMTDSSVERQKLQRTCFKWTGSTDSCENVAMRDVVYLIPKYKVYTKVYICIKLIKNTL